MPGGFVLRTVCSAFLLLCLARPVPAQDIKLARMAQKQQHFEIIRTLQPRIDRQEAVPSAQLMFLAGAYSETRNYSRLFPTCDRLQRQIEGGDARMFGGDLSALPHFMRANAFLDLGDPERALMEAQAADAILAGQTSSANAFLDAFHFETWGALGVAQALLGHSGQARACVARLEGVDLGATLNGPQKFTAIAKIHMALGDYAKALEAVRNPRAEYHGLASLLYDNTFQVIPLAYIQARCQLETGRVEEARAGYDRLLRHPRLAEVGGLHWPVLLDRARIALRDGQDPLAEDLLRRSVEVVERQRASIGTEAGRIGFVGDKQACYEELVALLARLGRAREAFEFVERAKGRALVDLLASQKQLGRPGDQAVLARLDSPGLDLRAIPDPAAPDSRGILVAARRELQARAPELASLVSVQDVRAGAIQARLGTDETLVEYYAAGPRWMAFVVTRTALTAHALEAPDLEARVRELRRTLADPGREPAQTRELQRMLLDRLDLATPRLTIVPHGVLHYVPFCALGTRDAALLDRFSLRILPSATLLTFLKPRKAGGGSLILGNPDLGQAALDLPFAQEEAEALARILPEPSLRLREAATAGEVAKGAGRFRIIHLAAHGFFDDAHPLESALFLARGALKVADLYRLDLDADLVTLSACETALSTVSRGDEVVGFTRGLLYAGSRSVLSSLWKVDDRCTRDLMVAFYRNLPGSTKTEALRDAQRAVRAGHPHPYYWAAFRVTGNLE